LKYQFVAVSGTIGAGKSALASRFASLTNSQLILEEFANNSFLEKFYSNPERYAFPLEISFLFERFQQMKTTFANADLFKTSFIADYFFDKSLLFAKNNLTADQFAVFYPLFETFREQLPSPDLLIYLKRPVDVLLKNIQKRGRSYEQSISPEYLENIQHYYLTYLKSLQHQRVLIIEMEDKDFIADEKNFRKLYGLLFTEFLPKIHFFNINDEI